MVVDGGREEERTQEEWGCSVSQPALFFWRLHSSFSLLSSHSGTGSLTAAATELDGCDLIWLEKTFVIHVSFFFFFLASTKTRFLCSHVNQYVQLLKSHSHIFHSFMLNIQFTILGVLAAADQQEEPFSFNLDHCSTWWIEVVLRFYYPTVMIS